MKRNVFIFILITFSFYLHAQERQGHGRFVAPAEEPKNEKHQKHAPGATKDKSLLKEELHQRKKTPEEMCTIQKHLVDSFIRKFSFDEARKYYYEGKASEAMRKCDFSVFDSKIALMNEFKVINVYNNGTAQLNRLSNNEYVIVDDDYKFVTVELKEVTINNEFYSGTFSGQVKDGKPNGKGKIDGTNNVGVKFVYEGDLVNGLANGTGKVTLPSGDTYEGQWLDGYRNGTGTYTWATRFNGLVFKGEWANDKVTKGSFFNADGSANTEYTISVR